MDLKPDQKRQATAPFRGYAYQCYQSILAWLNCAPNEEIWCEFAEDIDKVRRDLNGEIEEAELNQVKHESQNVTLNSLAVTSLINNYFEHKERNPTIKIKIRLCTISGRGQECNVNWQYANCGLDLWDKLKQGKLDGKPRADSILALRSYLKETDKISSKAKAFLESCNDFSFQSDFIEQISWDTGQLPYQEIEQEIRELLATRPRPITDPMEVQQTVDRLWRHIVDLISTDPERALKHDDLEEILSQETTAKLDRQTLQKLSTDVSKIDQRTERFEEALTRILTFQAPQSIQESHAIQINPQQLFVNKELPPLPNICSQRVALLENLQSRIPDGKIIWIYGSTGFGKTTVANLLVRHLNTPYLWFRLRDMVDFELLKALSEIIRQTTESLSFQSIIVLDDFSCRQVDINQFELLQRLVQLAQEQNFLVLVTSQGSVPSRLVSLLGDLLVKFDLPGMSLEDIKLLLSAVGLVDQTECIKWATHIILRTQGHPQLVGAHVTYFKGINWDFSLNVLTSNPQTVEEIQRESRQQLADSIHFEEARELAKRLSIVKIQFPREFALAVGKGQPSLREAGRAFDSLLGPWIEQIDSNNFLLSPLLEGYAESEVGTDGLSNFQRMVAYAWYRQNKLTPSQFFQLITTALAAKEEFLVASVGLHVLSLKREDLKLISKHLWHISILALETNSVLSDFKPYIRILFRQAQLRIARHTGQRDLFVKLDKLIIEELETGESNPRLTLILIMFYINSCLYLDSFLEVKERIRRAIKSIEMVKGGEVDPKIFGHITTNDPIEALVMFATSTLESRDDLDYLFEKLKGLSNDAIKGIFSVFNEHETVLLLLMDRVWLAESKKESPEWERCISLYADIMVFAKDHNLSLLFDAAARAQIIIYDEYLEDSRRAIQLADEARHTNTTEPHPVIDLAESTVIFRTEEPSRALDLLDCVDRNLPPNQLILERLFALRRAIKVAGANQDWIRVTSFVTRGFELTESLPNSPLKQVAIIGLHAESGWVNHEQGNMVSAANEFEKVLKNIESFPDQSNLLFHMLRLRFGHMLAWVAHFLKGRQESTEGQAQDYKRPFCGMFVNLEDPPGEVISRKPVPQLAYWAMLASYAAWVLPRTSIRAWAERGRLSTSEGQFQIAVWVSWDAVFANDLSLCDFNAAFQSGLENVGCGILAEQIGKGKNIQDLTNIYGDFKNWSQQLSPHSLDELAGNFPSIVIDPILMTLCSMISSPSVPSIDLMKWRESLINILGEREIITTILDWITIALRSIDRDEASIRKVREFAFTSLPGVSANEHRMAQLICCGSLNLSVKENLGAQTSILLSLSQRQYITTYEVAFTRMVTKRYIHLAENQRFLLSSPSMYCPRIRKAASSKVPTLQEVATLLLLVGEAIHIRWPDDILGQLRFLSTQSRLGP